MKDFLSADNSLLFTQQMAKADQAAIGRGISGETLMGNAGQAVVNAITERWEPQHAVVLCGPGNNGGDGFVIARL